ncbi:phosphotransferase [Micrococcales bacterium 31B]|nr:phosphotransferase [Micrococcales bacterium 31B]
MHEHLVLAALASGAVPSLKTRSVEMQEPQGNCDIAHITDLDGNRWVCRRPRDTHAGIALESEAVLLNLLTRAGLPFEVPRPTGFATLPAGGRAMVYPLIEGDKPYFFDSEPGSVLLDNIARALAALHEMPLDFAEHSSVPHYSAGEYRDRRITTLNLAEQTGKVPDTLVTRWRCLFHDAEFWQFRPVLTHGGLSTETLLVSDEEVRGVTQWGSSQIADPCDDLAWLVGQLSYGAAQYFFERYLARRNPRAVDPNMWERTNLISEMEPMERMLSAHRAGDAEGEHYAAVMLQDLEDSLAESVRRQAEYDLEATLQRGDALSQGLPFTLGSVEPGGFVTGGIRVLHPHSAAPGSMDSVAGAGAEGADASGGPVPAAGPVGAGGAGAGPAGAGPVGAGGDLHETEQLQVSSDTGVERVVGAVDSPRYNVSYSVSRAIEIQPGERAETGEHTEAGEADQGAEGGEPPTRQR